MNTKAIFRVLIAAAGFLLSAACYDDPVALNESEQPTLEEVPMETPSSMVGSSSIELVDNTRPRFRVGLSVEGALSPKATISLTLRGEAVERISNGTVTVVLPTMAGMTPNRRDQRPHHPVGQSFPVASNWTLPAMEPGDTWQRSFVVTLPGNGYYRVAVEVDTNGPVGDRDPYVDDEDLYFERWMLVTDTGGRLTLGFDESVFTDTTIAAVPGPFRKRAGQGNATSQAAAADAGMAMSSGDPVSLSVVYAGNGRFIAAVGAYVHATLWTGFGADKDALVSYSARVGDSGVVSFPCPPSGHYLTGGIQLESTVDINGNTFVSYWDADPSDCGDTFTAYGPRHYYLPWKNLKAVAPRVRSHFGIRPFQRVDWTTDLSDERTFYNPTDHRITFGSQSYANSWTAAHEYAHAMHEKALGGLWSTEQPACREHTIWKKSGYRCAFLEGFADYAANKGALWGPNWETPPDSAHAESPEVEGWVAALFQDLIDSANEDDDDTTYSPSKIGAAFRTCDVRVNGSWEDRDDVSDFVWCLENQINKSLHQRHFPGVTVPTSQRATRGSGWNASDIRSTWLQNLTS